MDCFHILYSLLFFCPLLPPVVSSDRPTNTILFYVSLHICTYMHVYVLIYAFNLQVYLPHVGENMPSLTSWAWLTLFNTMFSSAVHLTVNKVIPFFMAVILRFLCLDDLSIFFFIHLFIWAYIVLAISLTTTCPLHLPPPCFQAESVLPFSPILLKRRHKQ
jgi:hypothetical protein